MDKCKEQPKLYYKFIKEKRKNRDEIQKVIVNSETFDIVSKIVEVMNNYFPTVFTRGSEFESIQTVAEDIAGLDMI